MYHLTQSKGGISSIELGRRLGVTQTTAWKLEGWKLRCAKVAISARRKPFTRRNFKRIGLPSGGFDRRHVPAITDVCRRQAVHW